MINSISLKNFRSYKDSFIEFSPNVNVIIGENDSGKTNLLRAINLIVNNRPSGEDFRSDWGGDTDVAIDIGNKLVSRVRTDKENMYVLTHANGDEDIFKAFGKGVPEIIKQHLNMSPVNIAFQLEGPFLLGMSASDIAKHYNNAVNLDIIDRTISNIASTLRKERSALQIEKETEKKKNEELKEYDWLPEAEESVIKLEKLQLSINRIRNDWSGLASLINKLEEFEEANQNLSEITRHEIAVNILMGKREKIDEQKNDHNELAILIEDIKLLVNQDEELKEIIQHQNEVTLLIEKANQIDKIEENITELKFQTSNLKQYLNTKKQYENIIKYADMTKALLVLDREIEKDISMYNSLQELLSKRQSLNQEYKDTGTELKGLEVEFKDALPERCPIFDVSCKHMKEAKNT